MSCSRSSRLLLGALVTAVSLGSLEEARAQRSPSDYLGYPVGADRRLADWTEVTGYLAELASLSERIRIDTLGNTTLGRPFVLLTISDPTNLASLDDIQETQLQLADPRLIRDQGHLEELVGTGRSIVLITCSVHSTEVGSTLVPLRIAYRLATSAEPDVKEILANTVVLLIPSLNPDGVDKVVAWYRTSLGTEWEGASPPFLYHHYIGHDNNRDWYAFTQVETQMTVDQVHNAWHPQIVHDIHQQGRHGSRFFVPPWIDPIEPNVDPMVVASGNALGSEIAWSLLREGKKGVVLNATYDAWTPARAYQHYHAGVRILTETASAKLATPVEVDAEELEPGRGFDPRERSWNFPVPWEGGSWHLTDIVDYMEAGAFALLRHAARNREVWLRNFVGIGERAVAGWPGWPAAWIVPPARGEGAKGPWPEIGVARLIGVLRAGDVEVDRALQSFEAEGRRFPAGSYIVEMRQPYAAFAQTLLEAQRYPDRRAYDGGPLLKPYDVTAHTLPLLFGVEAVAVEEPIEVEREVVLEAPAYPVPLPEAAGLVGSDERVALYQPWAPSMDEGWTRWIFDRYGVPYATVRNEDINGDALDGFTSVLLASIPADVLRDGLEQDSLPPEFTGGLNADGVDALRRFVERGGTLVAFDRSVEWVIDELGLPVRNLLSGLEEEAYAAPGSLVRIELESRHPMTARMPGAVAGWLQGGPALEAAQDARVRVVARYASEGLLLSGWLQGEEHLAGHPAIVDVPLGEGRVILFGIRPQYRGQSLATLPLLFDALKAAPHD
jgi:hypothetical protein